MSLFFPRGASYYPPHHASEDWERDVAAMVAAGMNCIRSAELLSSWDYIEKEPGRPAWDWLDALFDAAERHDIRILLGTGSPNPPIWLLDRYPDLQIIDRDGRPFPIGTVWGWACRNHPGYRVEVERYLRLLAGRYAGRRALWAWQIDNEPGFPFIPRQGEARPRLHDYNPHTAAAFRTWLEQKYVTLDALNVAWRWDCTHHQYADWAQVQPPRSMPQEWGVVTAWLDWRTFLYENMAAFVGWQRALLRELDPHHPAMTNIFAFAGCEVEMGLDPWRMAGQVDAIGYDMYPGIGRRLHREPEYISMFLDMGRSTAQRAGVAFWLPELESGPVNGWALGPDYTTKPQDILRYNLEALAHGARAILYQGYREWPCIPIHWGALADFRGEPTPRYEAARQINQMLAADEALFNAARPARAKAAIMYDTRNLTLLHGMGADDLLRRCVRGAYATLWRAGYPAEFVDAAGIVAMVSDAAPLPYRVLLLPAALLIAGETGHALRRFVERGGTLIGFAKCGWVDGGGWSWAQTPGAALHDVFGATMAEAERDDECRIERVDWGSELPQSASDRPPHVPGYWHRQVLVPHPGTQVLGWFADGEPALVRHTLGAGQAFLLGTHLDAAALDQPVAATLLQWLVERAGLEPPLDIEADAPVDAHVLEAGTARLVILTNNSPNATVALFRLQGTGPQTARELLHGHVLAVADRTVSVELAPWNGAVVVLA
jgi:beta-galactosidase